MHYRIYNTEDFLFDESFRQWTSGTSVEATIYWEKWLQDNPDRTEVVRQAQELIRALNDYYQDDATEIRLATEQNRLMQLVAEQRDTNVSTGITPYWQQSWFRWSTAASIALLLGLSLWFYPKNKQKVQESAYKHFEQKAAVTLEEKRNDSNKAIHVLLSDGSLITLEPKSRLSYPSQFAKNNRTVFLKGEAFFEVTKNPNKPFLIYANKTVTKVLGTSFLVRAFGHEKNVTVTVHTGRVSVCKLEDFEKAQQSGTRNNKEVILIPNQQMTFNLEKNQLVKTLIQSPSTLPQTSVSSEIIFEDTPATKVFDSIKKRYGLPIQYNSEELTACLINLSFSNESLLEQLDIICQTIGATYEIQNGGIRIYSKGCR